MTTLKATQSRPTKYIYICITQENARITLSPQSQPDPDSNSHSVLQLNCALKLQVSRSSSEFIKIICNLKILFHNLASMSDSDSDSSLFVSISARSCSRGQRNVLLPVSTCPPSLRTPSAASADARLSLCRHPSM